MMKKILLGAAVVFASSTAAFAADAVYEPIPTAPEAVAAPPAYSWAGGYVGLNAGYGWGEADFNNGGVAFQDDFDGARFGGFVGYNWEVSSGFIAGVEADLNYDWNENSYAAGDVSTGLNGGVRARLGFAADRALFYAAGGYTATGFNIEGPGVDVDETLHGWTLGAGVDFALTDRVFTRVEYRYNDYGDRNILGVNTDFNQHVVGVGLGVKF